MWFDTAFDLASPPMFRVIHLSLLLIFTVDNVRLCWGQQQLPTVRWRDSDRDGGSDSDGLLICF